MTFQSEVIFALKPCGEHSKQLPQSHDSRHTDDAGSASGATDGTMSY